MRTTRTQGQNRNGNQSSTRNARTEKKPKIKKSKSKSPTRESQIRKMFNERYDFQVRPKSDSFYVDSIAGKYSNDVSLWPAVRVRRARTAACLGTKIKSSDPLRSDKETINEFRKTQVEPVISARIGALVKSKIDEMFKSFPYEEVLYELNDPCREKVITQGSAYPQLLAPPIIYKDGSSNTQMLCAMAAGEDIFDPDFHVKAYLEGRAHGKITTVDKNFKTRRMITICSRESIDSQLFVSNKIRDWITIWSRTANHIIQFDDQTVQHKLLLDGYATIDLSSASDRVYRSVIEMVWPEFMKHFGFLLPTTVITDEGRITNLTCIGTQGFPLTFTLMAVLCGAITAALKLTVKPSGNYGDDIALAEVDFAEVYTGLEALGLVVNRSKTHLSSTGFLESCGVDVQFKEGIPRVVTPIHLRGESDVEVIQFFYQLCYEEIIPIEDAIYMLDKLSVEYYAFKYDYQITDFHFPFGEPYKVPRAVWSADGEGYLCKVPQLRPVADSIKGLSRKESTVVLDLLRIEAEVKNFNVHELTFKGSDSVARPHRFFALQEHSNYKLYIALEKATGHDFIHYQVMMKEFKVSFKTLVYYRFITSEMQNYMYGTAKVDFSSCKIKEFTYSEFLDDLFGINPKGTYPIFRYKNDKTFKQIGRAHV